ncbi:choice-of-anchor J domain-containing protein [uncultured Winogradskyella sp.]|uniref:choice-of-anchor J domain-containing protein n=1 Tax=uncultured Winogradskyella sp. TaxID=395353 RepID=UPI0030DA05C2|tara:strand:+ start:239588 stop:246916 length:7329 start_codon:yes stop_codon:yes gene_type:complete
MRNKLQTTVAFNYFFPSNNSKSSEMQKTKSGKLNLIMLFAFTLFSLNNSFAQLTETFDSGIPPNWTLFGNNFADQDWSATTDGYLGTNGTSLNPSIDNIGDQNTALYFLVTPQIAVPENGEIQFYTKQASEVDNGTQYEVRLSTAAQPDINGFNITIQSYTETNLNVGAQTSYEKKVIELPPSIPAGLNIYVAFVAVNTQNGASPTGDEWFVDNVSIIEGCTEVEDNNVTIDAITVNGAEVSWTHPTATNFEIQILPVGGVPADSGISVTGNTYTLTNLDEDSDFEIYISAICDNDTQSEFTGPYAFSTLKFGLSCDAPIVIPDISTTPYILQDNLDNWENPDVVYTTQGSNCITGTDTSNYLNGNKIFLSYTPTQDGLITLTQTTFVEAGGGEDNCFNDRSSLFVYDSCASVGVNCTAGITTEDPFDPKTISNLLVQAGETYIIVVSSELSVIAGICFELQITAPTCAPPGDIVYNNLTEDSVSFSWENIGGFADSWEYVIVPTGSGEPTGSGIATNTNLNNVVNTGLVSATTYDIYVRSLCTGAPGVWSNPSSFTTQCTVFNTPYSTDFASATNANPEPCWTTIDANGDGTTWAFIGGFATTVVSSSQFSNNDLYVSPQINFDGVQKRLRYKHRTTQGVATYTVKLSTTGIGVDDFTTVILPETTINNTSFQEIIVDIPETIVGNVNIAFIVEPNMSETALRISIDDVFIEDKPTCPDPLNPFVLESSITTDTAWLLWTAGDDETQWQVAIQDEATGLPTEDGTLVSSNFPYIASGLTPGNRYEFYVRAYCAANDQSEWVGPVLFTTLCEAYDTPFFESYNDDDANTQKFCWEINDANSDETTWSIGEERALLQTAPFAPPSGFNDWLISPAINLDGTPKELKFKYRADFSFFSGSPRFGLEVLMSTTNTNPGSFSVISPLEIFTNSNYEEKSIIIEGTGTVYIAFRVPPEFTGGWSILSIDDVSITDAPACPNPTDLVVNNIFVNSADLSWAAGFQETSWNVIVQTAGSGLPTVTGETVTTTSYTGSDLLSDTEYEFYVMADCGAEDSEWVGPIIFRTACAAFTTPFVETFNSNSDSENCWRVINENDDGETWELNSGVFPFEGDQAATMFTGQNGNNNDWLISPTITITENQRLRYYYRVNDSFFTEDLDVLLSTTGIGIDQFTTILYDSDTDLILINNEEYRVKIINFPAGVTGDINIAFHVPFFASTGSTRGQTLAIDNVVIEDIPECSEPTNITLTNITDTAAQINWDANGSETAWEISVQPFGTPAPIGDADPNFVFNTTTNPFTVTGLIASTQYQVYIRAICDDMSQSEWSSPVELLTKCSFENLCEYTFILSSDFSGSSFLDITQNNQVTQSLAFTGDEDVEYTVFLCSGVEFSLYFNTVGSFTPQYANYQFEILDSQGLNVYTSPLGLVPKTTVYEGFAACGNITCPEPTNLSISDLSIFSWVSGGGETQWEVAVQPLENGTIPQSGTIVSTNSYTPTAADFSDPNTATYEYFVRAICGTDDESFWSGPFVFTRNDDISNAIDLPVNLDEFCNGLITEVSFINTSVSSEAMSCEGINGGDVWFSFVAESKIHNIIANGFNGTLRDNDGSQPYPDLIMTLYREDISGTLEELTCSYDNLITAMYASELIVGDTYKVRLTKIGAETTDFRLSLCITTPADLCDLIIENGDLEKPVIDGLSGIGTIITSKVVPGWRTNFDTRNNLFIWEALNAPGFEPYQGGQCVQLITDEEMIIDPNDQNVYGLYREFDTSEVTLFDFSYAHLSRFDGNIVQLFAGPPEGPFTMVSENTENTQVWELITGQYSVPNGQSITRFVFVAAGDNQIGNIIDAVNIVANNEIITEPFTVDCDDTVANIAANGTGTWIASDANPGIVTIVDANSNTASITDFTQPGTYSFTWQTRYCSYNLEITYNGVTDIPTVESPVEYCLGDAAEVLTASSLGAYSLIWYAQAVGGTGNVTAPTPDTSVVNTTSYYVAFVDVEGCEGPRAEIVVIVNESFIPELMFSYEDTCIVETINPNPILSDGFAIGGTFSSTTLTVDAATGEIDITSAVVGPHDITYTYSGDETTCTAAGTFTTTLQFTVASIPITGFNYDMPSYCELESATILPILDTGFITGGTFNSSTLTVNTTTGEIDLSTATVGSHDITYTVEANATTCSNTGLFTTTIQITASTSPVTEFTYAEEVYCADSSVVLPELIAGFTTGGTFSSESGLIINALTGEINVASSTVGNYDVSYTILADLVTCAQGAVGTFNITILDEIEVGIEGECSGSDYVLTAFPLNSSYDASEVNYMWQDANGTNVGQNTEVFNVSEYASLNPNVMPPLEFTITVTFGDCSVTQTFATERLSCKDIPRGISPDGNNKNDNFDLTGFGVNKLSIFNRYGTEVYKFSGLYSNQWFGQTNDGKELPSGTYFYSIHKDDGSSLTGWVFINRAQ